MGCETALARRGDLAYMRRLTRPGPIRARRVRGRSSAGRALQWHCRGQGFDPPRLHQFPLIQRQFEGSTDARVCARALLFLLHLTRRQRRFYIFAASAKTSETLRSWCRLYKSFRSSQMFLHPLQGFPKLVYVSAPFARFVVTQKHLCSL